MSETVEGFGQWISDYTGGAGDAAIATARLKDLREIRKYLDMGISDLEKIIADELPVGVTETPLGAVTVRRSAETFVYPKAGTDEHRELFLHVVGRLLDKIDPDMLDRPEKQVADMLFDIFPMGAQNARSGNLKKLTGLALADYRLSGGRKVSVQVH